MHAFVKVCAKHSMYVYPPRSLDQGEDRNGRFPDWLLKKGIRSRKLLFNGHEVKLRGVGQFESNPFLGRTVAPCEASGLVPPFA